MPDYTVTGPKGGPIIKRAPIARVRKVLPDLVKRFGKVGVRQAPAPPLTLRQLVVRFARQGVSEERLIHYAETRPIPIPPAKSALPKLPFTTDCSGFATLCYHAAGAPDPIGLGYNGQGYTGTLLAHALSAGRVYTDVRKARPGDLIVYGPGDGWHVAVIVEPGTDPLTVSHGQEAGPQLVRVSQDGRQPQRILSYLP